MLIQDRLLSSREYIKSAIANGTTMSAIAKEFDCNPGTIWYFLVKNNIPFKAKQPLKGMGGEYKERILQLWNEGNSAYKIAKILELNKTFVNKHLKKWGIDTSVTSSTKVADAKHGKDRIKVADKKDEILKLYAEGKNQNEIAEMFGFNSGHVHKFLVKNGVETRPLETYDFDETYFDRIDTPNKAYCLGLLMADGSVSDGKLRISLAETDKCVLDALKIEWKYEGPLYLSKSKNVKHQNKWELCVNRKDIHKKLTALGCESRKTWTMRAPSLSVLPEELRVFFLCGFIMGDGSVKIGTKKNRGNYINLTSNYDFLQDLIPWLGVEVGRLQQRYKDRPLRESSHGVFISKTVNFRKLGNYLYSDENLQRCSLLSVDRKCAKFRAYAQSLKDGDQPSSAAKTSPSGVINISPVNV